MRRTDEKGILMNRTESSAQKPLHRTGIVAAICAFLSASESSSALHTYRGPRIASVSVPIFIAILFVAAAPAHATPIEPPTVDRRLDCVVKDHTSMVVHESVGLHQPGKTDWSYTYSTSPAGTFIPVPGGSGTFTQEETEHQGGQGLFADTEVTGLTPEVTYYFRFVATNAAGTANAEASCETEPLRPSFSSIVLQNVTPTSAYAQGGIYPNGSATNWRFELAPAEPGGQAPPEDSPSWTPSSGAEGSISQSEAESLSQGPYEGVRARLTPLIPGTAYYVRLVGESEPEFPSGSGELHSEKAISQPEGFETTGPPRVTTFATHAFDGESLRILGSVNPNSTPTSAEQRITIEGAPTGGTFALTFNGQTTGAAGSGDVAGGSGTGTGDLNFFASGVVNITRGSTVVNGLQQVKGVFAVGEPITDFEAADSGGHVAHQIPPGTKIVAVDPIAQTLTLSNAATASLNTVPVISATKTISGVGSTTGTFEVGQRLSAPGLPPDTAITAVGPGTLTVSNFPTSAGSGVSLTASPDMVANLSISAGSFLNGEVISGPGIPAGTTVTSNEAGVLRLSAESTAAGSAVALDAGLPRDAEPELVERALEGLPNGPRVRILGPAGSVHGPSAFGGPYTVIFFGPDGEVAQPQIACDGSSLTPLGAGCSAITIQHGGEANDTHYHFEYESQRQFEEGGVEPLANASSTTEFDAGSGGATQVVGADLPGLTPGETYRYRVVATNDTPGNPVVHGEEKTLTAPTPAPPAPPAACPNAQLRFGPSANLPDCRAYEQLTPADKEGSQEIFHYGATTGSGALAALDGDHLMLEAEALSWGSTPSAGQSPYFFSRTPAGWQLTAASSQPETGVNRPVPQLLDSNLSQLGFASAFNTGGVESSEIEFRAGRPGGPYTTVASVPRKGVANDGGWVAASPDLSKLILQVEDRQLVEPPSTTKSGADLYEYSGEELRQVNVGAGTCGAHIVNGREGGEGGVASNRHAVSVDGSRVFFEAVPAGHGCFEPTHLFVRVNGGAEDAATVDIGEYTFIAANPQGTELLLEHRNGEAREFFLYETEPTAFTPLFTTHSSIGEATASEDLSTLYFTSIEKLTPEAPSVSTSPAGIAESLYRFDMATKQLSFLTGLTPQSKNFTIRELRTTPDGHFAYFAAGPLAAVPGGAGMEHQSIQLYRFDSFDATIQCVACASSFDSKPKLIATMGANRDLGRPQTQAGNPNVTLASANGNFAFFSTPAALLRSDVDGEVTPEFANHRGPDGTLPEHGTPEEVTSVSSDIYEWRANGIDGCIHVQGCLDLITSGRGGFLNLLLGTAEEGRDAFIFTNSQLGPRDNDSAGDIYDARIGGGESAPPPRPVECNGDACSNPVPAPDDTTPGSSTYHGPGNEHPRVPSKHKKHHPKRHKAKQHGKRAGHNRRGHR